MYRKLQNNRIKTVEAISDEVNNTPFLYNQIQLISMALDIANILLWHMDIKENLYFFDYYKLIEDNDSYLVEKEDNIVDYDEILGRIFPDDRPLFQNEMARLLNGEIKRMRIEVRISRIVNGSPAFIWNELISIIDKYDTSHRPVSVIGLSIDINQRKNNELELIKQKNRAEESNILKSMFLANMSHEIRTPLNAIIGFSQVLSYAENEQERQSYIDIIQTNNNLLLQLIDDILDLSKIESGSIEFNFTKVNLYNLLQEAMTIIRNRHANSPVNIVMCGQDSSINIITDANRLMQVVINLMNNALKFTDNGCVTLGYIDRKNEVYVYVEDTGIGIPADKLKEIFGRFVKLNSFRQGTGLGLSICETIVHKLGGEIGVESVENKGSKFWFTLPK